MKNADNDVLDDRRVARREMGPFASERAYFTALLKPAIGFRVYGAGAIALGLVGVLWGDFALVWQPVPSDIPGRQALAYLTAAAFLLAGVAVQWQRTARAGLVALSILYTLVVVLMHAPRVIAHPLDLSTWAGLAEQLALVAAGLAATAAPFAGERTSKRLLKTARVLFALCLFLFGLVHFVYAAATASFVPKWLPPGQLFWAYLTGLAQWAACLAILSGVLANAAAKLLTVMFVVFSVLVHVPALFIASDHLSWAANAMNLAMIGAAWAIADTFTTRPENRRARHL